MNAPAIRPAQAATVPVDLVSQDDIDVGKEKLDQWLRQLTGDVVGWDALQTAGSVIPGVGTVFAAIDAIGDLLTLIEGDQDDYFTWVSFGVNVFGLVPFPGIGAARLAIRSTLSSIRRNGTAVISEALLEALEQNLNDKVPGTLENFATGLESRIADLLTQVAAEIRKACMAFAEMLRSVASDVGQDALIKKAKRASIFFGPAVALAAHFMIEDRVLYRSTCQRLLDTADRAEQIGHKASGKIMGMADARIEGSIGYLVNALVAALKKRKGLRPLSASASVSNGRTSQARHVQGQKGLTTRGTERPAKKDPNCRNGAPMGSGCSISFATGSETIIHTDFTLPGVFPIDWVRTYRSSLAAMDGSPFGARWMTTFSLCIDDLGSRQLAYHGADGRTHGWYQCDQLGTPMKLTLRDGSVGWSGTYKAWGYAEEKRNEEAKWEGIQNQLRFQGQHFDKETNLHYSRYRYYCPEIGRFISKDPIGFSGGINVYTYTPNPVGWIDPLGLSGKRPPNLTPPGAGRRGAFREAKRNSDIPVCSCPSRVTQNVDKRGNVQEGKVYEFDRKNADGDNITTKIRDDAGGHNFGVNNPQNRGPHFNDESNGHYDY
ncbi:MAG: RHS repeat-associated core domain-containing protein [Pseudomonas sp.]